MYNKNNYTQMDTSEANKCSQEHTILSVCGA
jgi:hypothetical protein